MHLLNGIALLLFVSVLCWAEGQWDIFEFNDKYISYRRITNDIIMIAPINRLNQEASMECVRNFFNNEYFIPIEVLYWKKDYLEDVREAINNRTGSRYKEALSLRVTKFRLRWRDRAFMNQAARNIIMTEEWIPNRNSGVLPESFTYLLGLSISGNRNLSETDCKSATERLRHGRSKGLVNLFLSEFMLASDLIDTEKKSDIRMIFEKDLNVGKYISIINSQRLPFLLEKSFIRQWAHEVVKIHTGDNQLALLKENAIRQQIEDYICHNETTEREWQLHTSRLFRQIYPRLSRTDMSTKYSATDFCTIKSRYKTVNLLVTSYTTNDNDNAIYVDYLQL